MPVIGAVKGAYQGGGLAGITTSATPSTGFGESNIVAQVLNPAFAATVAKAPEFGGTAIGSGVHVAGGTTTLKALAPVETATATLPTIGQESISPIDYYRAYDIINKQVGTPDYGKSTSGIITQLKPEDIKAIASGDIKVSNTPQATTKPIENAVAQILNPNFQKATAPAQQGPQIYFTYPAKSVTTTGYNALKSILPSDLGVTFISKSGSNSYQTSFTVDKNSPIGVKDFVINGINVDPNNSINPSYFDTPTNVTITLNAIDKDPANWTVDYSANKNITGTGLSSPSEAIQLANLAAQSGQTEFAASKTFSIKDLANATKNLTTNLSRTETTTAQPYNQTTFLTSPAGKVTTNALGGLAGKNLSSAIASGTTGLAANLLNFPKSIEKFYQLSPEQQEADLKAIAQFYIDQAIKNRGTTANNQFAPVTTVTGLNPKTLTSIFAETARLPTIVAGKNVGNYPLGVQNLASFLFDPNIRGVFQGNLSPKGALTTAERTVLSYGILPLYLDASGVLSPTSTPRERAAGATSIALIALSGELGTLAGTPLAVTTEVPTNIAKSIATDPRLATAVNNLIVRAVEDGTTLGLFNLGLQEANQLSNIRPVLNPQEGLNALASGFVIGVTLSPFGELVGGGLRLVKPNDYQFFGGLVLRLGGKEIPIIGVIKDVPAGLERDLNQAAREGILDQESLLATNAQLKPFLQPNILDPKIPKFEYTRGLFAELQTNPALNSLRNTLTDTEWQSLLKSNEGVYKPVVESLNNQNWIDSILARQMFRESIKNTEAGKVLERFDRAVATGKLNDLFKPILKGETIKLEGLSNAQNKALQDYLKNKFYTQEFGTASAKLFLGKDFRLPHDLDLNLQINSESLAKQMAKDIAKKLNEADPLEPNRFVADQTLVVDNLAAKEAGKAPHVVDIHYVGEPEPAPEKPLGYTLNVDIANGKFQATVSPLGNTLLGKLSSSVTGWVTPTGDYILAPASYRLKDLADSVVIAENLVKIEPDPILKKGEAANLAAFSKSSGEVYNLIKSPEDPSWNDLLTKTRNEGVNIPVDETKQATISTPKEIVEQISVLGSKGITNPSSSIKSKALEPSSVSLSEQSSSPASATSSLSAIESPSTISSVSSSPSSVSSTTSFSSLSSPSNSLSSSSSSPSKSSSSSSSASSSPSSSSSSISSASSVSSTSSTGFSQFPSLNLNRLPEKRKQNFSIKQFATTLRYTPSIAVLLFPELNKVGIKSLSSPLLGVGIRPEPQYLEEFQTKNKNMKQLNYA